MPDRLPLRKMLFHSVRGRLALLVAGITFTALILGLLLVAHAFRSERQAVEKHLSATARALASGVDLQLGQYEALLKGLATFPSLKRGDLKAFDVAARAVAEGTDTWVVLAETNGQQLVNTHIQPGTPLPLFAFNDEALEVLKQGGTYISDVVQGPVAKGPVLYVAMPAVLESRPVVIAYATVPGVFAEGLSVRSLSTNGVVGIVDRKGVIAARNRNPEKYVGRSATGDLRTEIAEKTHGTLESVTLDGIPVLTAFCRSHAGWTVVNAVPREEIYSSAGRLVTLALGLSGVLLAVAVFLAAWIGRAVVDGMAGLVKSTKAVGAGELPPVETTGLAEIDFVSRALRSSSELLMARNQERHAAEQALREESRVLELLNNTGTVIASQLDLQNVVQVVTDSARELSGAKFGAFFYTKTDEEGKVFTLYTLSGAPREAFEKFGHPRATPLFGPTFEGQGPIRIDDVLQDPRYGKVAPHYGMPKGHLPVRSYLAVPVISRSGKVLGGLFFGHSEPGMFTARSERLVSGVAAQAAVAIDNAMLYETSQREIAERKRAEAELQLAKEELEQKVAQRTASLQDTTQQLETFCYSIAHDLRAPLRSQQSFAQVLLEDYGDRLDDTGRDYVQRIVRSAGRLDALVNDLLSYSRITRGELQFAKVDLGDLVSQVQQSFADQIEKQKAKVTVGNLYPVLAHESTLNLVITNLLGNALKFVEPNVPPQVRICAEESGGRVRLWVEDNGIGISPIGLTKIFGVFERLHPVNIYPGTGIGLAIVKKAVERMGGTVGVQSEAGKGSRFWIELPSAVAEA